MALDQQTLNQLRIDREAGRPADRRGIPVWCWILLLLLIPVFSILGWRISTSAPSLEVRVAVVRELSGSAPARTVLNGSGYVTARREATVSAKITGKVMEVMVEEGKRVEANQVLARLDSSNLTANRQLAEAQLASAKIAVNETAALLEQARAAFDRMKQLVADKVGSPAEFDKAQADFRSLQAHEQRQRFEVIVAEKALALWDQQLEDAIIRAPFAGVVTAKNAQPGEMISPMSSGGFTRTGICTLVDMDSLEIEVEVNESYINRVTPGQSVEATLDAYSDWKIPTKVIAIIPTADRQKATVKVRVGFEKLDPRILPQMGVKVAFRGNEEPAVPERARRLSIPKAAVQDREGKNVVWVVKDGRVERRAIDVRSLGNDEMQVEAGVFTGERLVLDPPVNLADGARVKEAKP